MTSSDRSMTLRPKGMRAGGVLVALAALGMVWNLLSPPTSVTQTHEAYPLFLFVAMGLSMASFRYQLEVSGARNELVVWWGFLLPLSRRRRRLDGIREVVIEEEERRNVRTFAVRLRGAEEPVVVFESAFTLRTAQLRADEFARLLSLPVRIARLPPRHE